MNTLKLTARLYHEAAAQVVAIASLLLFIGACSTTYPDTKPPLCDFGDVQFHSDYAGGRVDGCSQSGPGSYILTMSPENSPINHSPWYSFRVESVEKQSISVSLQYTEHTHRYIPKLSADGEQWTAMPKSHYKVLSDGKIAKLTLEMGSSPLWVSAQEIVDNADYATWETQLAQHPDLTRSVLGKSVDGRDIHKLETPATGQKKYVVFVGRQHPPEITGALAMIAFVERVFAPDELAVEFRRQFGVLLVPNLNPDGVHLGNWRHNRNGVDLNRDWGPFTQPETQLMHDELSKFQQPDSAALYLFLDFHSTAEDVFYTQPVDMKTFPESFTLKWMSAMESRAKIDFPGYKVVWTPGHNPVEATSKNYVYDTFGIPAITFELGDETDRDFIDAYAATAAQEMMKTLLASEAPPPKSVQRR